MLKSHAIPVKFGRILLSLFILWGLSTTPTWASTKTLYLFNWAHYIGNGVIKKFEAKCGCKVIQSYYNSNAQLVAKLNAGGDAQYDVVVPTSFYISQLADEGLIQKLDHARLSNFKNLLPKFQNPSYDPHDAYSIPYQWGTTGVIYNTKKFNSAPNSWALLFDPKENPHYPFALIGGKGRETIGAACAYLGFGIQCSKKSQWLKAARLIEKTTKRPNFIGFVGGEVEVHDIEVGIIDAGMSWNGDIATCHAGQMGHCPDTRYIVPKEGTLMWVDTMAIPAHAPDPALAYEFINYILSAKAGAELSNFNNYSSPNAKAMPYLDKALSAPLVSPGKDEMRRLYFLNPLPKNKVQVFYAIWSAVREH
ncbi:spermidine/putrescine ABC transporter substrate-binding protein [Acidiphilium sp. AL]|uniref:Putrescine-binding periplasmic protein n=1 Tax=Acidiphilium iwatense TaxID=768198 RepID=A0ABS9DWK6_9PROT|nr:MULTISPECIES: spermidine/putrescine ABC transporter substrate-binding protein [Acidiphilium]MCF3946565.1 spermidine/putrescine ABC transporter substrate-binding protein [Acidiphilium iwatense]MCU4160254.1 spermidine/putrescine ABC transporter substrate-binding protein [Acidiphilium sp. AL]